MSALHGQSHQNINHHAVTPVWMQERLRRSGIRHIHPVVDVTNYVMLELGQPMHAFNLENIDQKIQVRMAVTGETLTLLDGRKITLGPQDLVIADATQALALAGVMGGAASGVAANTSHLFLESAFFSQIPLSLTARRHGLQSDSAYRFSRGVDFNLPAQALERATQLLLDIVGGQAGPLIEVTDSESLPKITSLVLRRAQIPRLLNIELSDAVVVEILESMGMIVAEHPEGWRVQTPGYRYDLNIEVDLIEELGRIWGYHRIPLQPMNVAATIPAQTLNKISDSRLLTLMTDRGYSEAITYSFISPRWQEWLQPGQPVLKLANAISSDMSVMRTSLWPGLIQALQYNLNRQISRVRLFETGLCFFPPESQPVQINMLAGAASGPAYPEQWGLPVRNIDFYDVKGDLEALLALTGQPQLFSWRLSHCPTLHPGQQAELWVGEQRVGCVGALHPALTETCGLPAQIYLFELNLDLIKTHQLTEFKNISKFPAVRRDMALIVDQATSAMTIEKFIKEKAGKLLNSVQIFDVYQGQNIENGHKSIALGLIFQDTSRTLKDEEIQAIVDYLIISLKQEFNANLRV